MAKKNSTIYTHAPIGLEGILKLASHLSIINYPLEDIQAMAEELVLSRDIESLTSIIDAINRQIQNDLILGILTEKINIVPLEQLNPFLYLLWNRDYSSLILPEKIQDCALSFVHGHDSAQPNSVNRFTLDNPLGKINEAVSRYNRYDFPIAVTDAIAVVRPSLDLMFFEELICSKNIGQLLKFTKEELVSKDKWQELLEKKYL